MIERKLNIGGAERTLRCTSASTIVFKKWHGRGLREALLIECDPGVIATAIASMLYRPGEESRNGAGSEKTGPLAVAAWIDADLGRYPEFEATVLGLAEEYFVAAKIVEKPAVPLGEAGSRTGLSPSPSSTSGTSSSGSQGDGGSTPGTPGT